MKSELSTRELSVLTFAIQGFTDDAIANELGIERGTVNSYWVRIRGKLGNLSRTELVARFVQKAADDQHAEYVIQDESDAAELAETNKVILEKTSSDAVTLADSNKVILDKANSEIEHLKLLLAKAEAKIKH